MSPPKRHRILYVEDDVAQARLVQISLDREGFSVDVAFDGLAGLMLYDQTRYDAVVVDQTMPLRSGLDIIRDMVDRGPLAPTIMVTGTGNEHVAVEVMKLGVSDYLVKDLEGGFIHLLPMAIKRAISQHRLVEEKHQAEEKLTLFRSFAEASVQGFAIADFERRVQYVNPALCRIVGGQNPAALIGKDYRDHIPPEDWEQRNSEIARALAENGAWTGETTLLTINGEAVSVLQSVFPICDNKGQPLFFGTTVTDVRERKRLEQELLQSQKLESIGHLAAGIAHEINTPIQYIGDNACFLQDAFRDIKAMMSLLCDLLHEVKQADQCKDLVGKVDVQRDEIELDYLMEEIPKAIHQSLEGVERVASIVGAMKEFSHPGYQEKQAVDLNHAIKSTLTISRNEWKYVADMVTDLDPQLPPVLCLPTEINQAILNIIVNAAHAVGNAQREGKKEKGTITVRTRRDGDWVEVRVEDTGTGIPESIRPRVFDPFFTTKDVGQGSGQGLAIARSVVVERHSGTIRFETQLGKGTTFIIRLPIAGRAASPCPIAPAVAFNSSLLQDGVVA